MLLLLMLMLRLILEVSVHVPESDVNGVRGGGAAVDEAVEPLGNPA